MNALSTLIIALSQSTPVDFPNQDGAYDAVGAKVYELAIVRYERRMGNDKRDYSSTYGTCQVRVSMDQFEVLDSSIPMAKRISVVTPVSGGPETPLRNPPDATLKELKPGQSYLLLTAKPNLDDLKWPIGAQWGNETSGSAKTAWTTLAPRKSKEEFVGLALFATKSKKVSGSGEMSIERLMENVANCLLGADLEGIQRACGFLVQSRSKPQIETERGAIVARGVPSDSACVAVMKKAYGEHAPSLGARIAAVLSNWKVPGSGRMLYESIKLSYNDPKLFSLRGDPWLNGPLDYHVERKVFDEEAYQLETNEEFDLSLKAKSPAVKDFLIQMWGNIVDVERRRTALLIAEASTDYNDRLAGIILRKIAFWYKDQDHVPDRQTVNRKSVIVNKAELFKYWRTMLGMGIKT